MTYTAVVSRSPWLAIYLHRVEHGPSLQSSEPFPSSSTPSTPKPCFIHPMICFPMPEGMDDVLAVQFLSDRVLLALVRSKGLTELVGRNYRGGTSRDGPRGALESEVPGPQLEVDSIRDAGLDGYLALVTKSWTVLHQFPDEKGFQPVFLDVRESQDGNTAMVMLDRGGKVYRVLQGAMKDVLR